MYKECKVNLHYILIILNKLVPHSKYKIKRYDKFCIIFNFIGVVTFSKFKFKNNIVL